MAVLLELLVVLAIWSIDRKHRREGTGTARSNARDNAVLVLFSTGFLVLTVASGVQGDYWAYLDEWREVLAGHVPWDLRMIPFNAYGPLFNVLAFSVYIDPLANKLLFAFCYIAYLIWLIKDLAPRRGFDVLSSWSWAAFWFLNPYPWEQIAYYGYSSILFSLACVAAVHCLTVRKDGLSGAYLAIGVLLKYIPIIALPFLATSERRLHLRLLGAFAAVVFVGMALSVAIWGPSTFLPLTYAATRKPQWSIYNVLAIPRLPFRMLIDPSQFGWIEKPLLLAAGLGAFAWSYMRKIEPVQSSVVAILATFLFYRAGNPNYEMVVLSLISYWWISNWNAFKTRSLLSALVFGYFALLAFVDYAFWWRLEFLLYDEGVMILCQFLLGCVVLVSLIRVPPATAAQLQVVSQETG
jgi:hypothetical protein